MRNFISSREIFIDKAFFKCTVKLLEWRNAQKKNIFLLKNWYHMEESALSLF